MAITKSLFGNKKGNWLWLVAFWGSANFLSCLSIHFVFSFLSGACIQYEWDGWLTSHLLLNVLTAQFVLPAFGAALLILVNDRLEFFSSRSTSSVRTISTRGSTRNPISPSKPSCAMFSARFLGGDIEQKMRKVHKILLVNGFDVLMVEVGVGDDFGSMTTRYLNRIVTDKGVLLAVCTHNYAEMTSSPYSSHGELKFALENHIPIWPLKVEKTFPPEPAYGPDHPYDKEGEARGLVRLAMNPSTVYLDCQGKTPEEIADAIGNGLAPAHSPEDEARTESVHQASLHEREHSVHTGPAAGDVEVSEGEGRKVPAHPVPGTAGMEVSEVSDEATEPAARRPPTLESL